MDVNEDFQRPLEESRIFSKLIKYVSFDRSVFFKHLMNIITQEFRAGIFSIIPAKKISKIDCSQMLFGERIVFFED